MKKKKTLFLGACLLVVMVADSQSVVPFIVNSTGGSGKVGNNHFDWSIGEETVIETMVKQNIIVTAGVLQPEVPYRDFKTECTLNNIKIYPNPTTNEIKVDLFFIEQGTITLNLYDASGRLLKTNRFGYNGMGHIENMDLSRFPSGTYILDVILEIPGITKVKRCPNKIIKLR